MNSSKHELIHSDALVTGERGLPAVVTQSPPRWLEPSSGPQAINLASYLEIPFMHKRLIVVCVLLGILFGWLAILLWPRSYASVSKMKVKVGRENVSLDPTATTGSEYMMLQKTQEEEVVTALEVLNSRRVAESVVDTLGVDAVLNGELPQAEGDQEEMAGGASSLSSRLAAWKAPVDRWIADVLLQTGVKDDIGNRELAIQALQKSLDISSPKKSAVVVVEGTSKSPEMAQAIVREVTNAFMEEHLKGSHTEGSFEFFDAQAAQVEKELRALIEQRAKFMQDKKIVSIESNRDLLEGRLAGLNRDLIVAYGELEKAMAESKDLLVKKDLAESEIVAEKFEGEDSTWIGMRQKIYELELQEQHASAMYTPVHPRLKRLRAQLEGARAILNEHDSERINQSMTPNPIKLGLVSQLQLEETAIAGLLSEIKEKETRQQEMQQEIDNLLDHERHLVQLDREIRLTENNLEAIRNKREEARILDELHENKFSNIHVFQPATFIERAVSPKKKIVGLGSLCLGLLVGVTLSFLREASSPTVRTPDDVELRLATPVAASIPKQKRSRSRRFGGSRVYRKKCQELMADILMSQHVAGRTRGRSIGVIGVDVGVGASTLAANLALASDVDCRLKTVLVDADSRQRSVSKMFGLNGSPGLVELLQGAASPDECIQKVNDGKVELVASAADSNCEMLSNSAEEIVQALETYLTDYDLLIVDLPAASQPDQAVALAKHLDCVLVVAESEKTQFAATERLLNRLYGSNTEVLGVVLTKTRDYLPRFVRPFVGPRV